MRRMQARKPGLRKCWTACYRRDIMRPDRQTARSRAGAVFDDRSLLIPNSGDNGAGAMLEEDA